MGTSEFAVPDIHAILSTHLADRYRIEREVGAGGMARVFLARDLRHGRSVALKVLNPELGILLGVERFLSEIKVTASLQHPNLLPLFDSGEAGGLLFYVMPFIEGGSLRDRLAREKHLPVEDAVRIAVSVANALHYAHRQGVVHRDLKPENILIHDGQPVVADFGIALAVSRAGGERFTQTGHSLGTPQYCSPEQASGDQTIDGRSDIYSLGAILYEMLAGDPPHQASTLQAIIARILTEAPRDLRTIRPLCPEHVALAVDCALQKLAADRFSTALEFAEALLGRDGRLRITLSSQVPVVSTAPPSRWRSVALYAAVACAAVSTSVAVSLWRTPRAEAKPISLRFPLEIAEEEFGSTGAVGVPFAFSPDGANLVYLASRVDGTSLLRHRPSNRLQTRDIPGTRNALHPTFSPDGRSIAFMVESRLMRVDLDGARPPAELTSLRDTVYGLAWGTGKIVVGRPRGGLLVLPSGGGAAQPLTAIDSANGERSHRWPVMLRDGRTVLFTIWRGQRSSATLAALSLDDGKIRRFDVRASAALGMQDDHLIVVDSTARVVAVPFDLASGKVTGSPLVGETGSLSLPGAPKAALSYSGTLAYYQDLLAPAELVFVDTAGRVRRMITQQRERFSDPRFSPDGRRLAVTISSDTNSEVFIVDLASGTRERLSTQEGSKRRPEWSEDGRRVLYQLAGSRGSEIWARVADKSQQAVLVLPNANDAAEGAPSADGRGVVYRTDSESRFGLNVWLLDTVTNIKPVRLGQGQQPAVRVMSPWVAYTSREGGTFEVFVSPISANNTTGGSPLRCPISDGGGTEPAWSADGRMLYYRQGYTLMRATLTPGAGCPSVQRKRLFELPMLTDEYHRQFDVAPDGSGFVMLREYRHESGTSIVSNWLADLRARTPGDN
jgi:serine/threonine-protein kinase